MNHKHGKAMQGFMRMLDLSQKSADLVLDLSNVTLIIGAALVLVGTIGVIWSGGIKERYADERISENETKTAQAMANAAVANEGAAKANARAAEANQKAEAERVERLKLELKLAPRSLSAAESQQLERSAASLKGMDVDIISYEGMGADVAALAMQIAEPLNRAGLNAKIFTPMGGGSVVRGILVRAEVDSPRNIEGAVDTLISAIKATGLDVDRWTPYPADEPPASAYNGPGSATAKLRILIGGKP